MEAEKKNLSITDLIDLIQSKKKIHSDINSLISDPDLIKTAEDIGCQIKVKKIRTLKLISIERNEILLYLDKSRITLNTNQ